MASMSSDITTMPLKIVVAGGFSVGKTTFIGAISEIDPLATEAAMTDRSIGIDDRGGIATKTATTVAMDFGRIHIGSGMVLYMFGTPGQERFWFMWENLVQGAIGAVVLVDTRRIEDCFPAIDYFEQLGMPFVVGVNCFDGAPLHPAEEVREALGVQAPVILMDARERVSVKKALKRLLEHAISQTAIAGPAARR